MATRLYVIDNNEEYEDNHIWFVETELSLEQMQSLIEIKGHSLVFISDEFVFMGERQPDKLDRYLNAFDFCRKSPDGKVEFKDEKCMEVLLSLPKEEVIKICGKWKKLIDNGFYHWHDRTNEKHGEAIRLIKDLVK